MKTTFMIATKSATKAENYMPQDLRFFKAKAKLWETKMGLSLIYITAFVSAFAIGFIS